ncbi:MAG: C2 domain-containing protein, partial [Deltaproteobacteria bacterium]|nr:C2 domain-containing protein [Deltaproteobacteria bacterium]
CRLDPYLTWALIAKNGTVSATTLADGDWDGDGNLPDPYVEVKGEGWSFGYTGYEDSNTLTPEWEYTIFWNFYTDDFLTPLEVTVWDKDGNADDFMGSCPLQITEEQMTSGEDIVVQCDRNQIEDDAGWTVTLYVVPMSEYYP